MFIKRKSTNLFKKSAVKELSKFRGRSIKIDKNEIENSKETTEEKNLEKVTATKQKKIVKNNEEITEK